MRCKTKSANGQRSRLSLLRECSNAHDAVRRWATAMVVRGVAGTGVEERGEAKAAKGNQGE
eukprot:12555090-Alexandrium_andersonii.AAC.1